METELVENGKYEPLFETRIAKGRLVYRLFSASIFVGIVCVWIYRVIHIPEAGEYGRMGWIGVYGAELWFGIYWIFTQAQRWSPVFRQPFRQTLLKRYGKALPRVDVFVCTADPATEPPIMVVNTVLSVMAYDYPAEKLSVYLSDDAGSELTFYALMEASNFSKHWIPYCKKFNIEPRSPAAYFSSDQYDVSSGTDFSHVKKLYQEMENRIESACQLGRIPTDEYHKHTGFSKWDPSSSRKDHAAILQIVIDGREGEAKDSEGHSLPNLVYMAREKRPHHFHNFKAGALNALIRVSSEISNAPIILTIDCDMYSNDSGSVQDALCFFMDEEKSNNIAYVQYPQAFQNITKNELYGGSFRIIYFVELHGMDGYGGPWYIGTGCFHRREALSGMEFSKAARNELLKSEPPRRTHQNVDEFEESLQKLVSCTYEENTQWGYEIGMKYGCLVEDVLTGYAILCKGWKSVYFSPGRKAFLGLTGTTLDQVLLQQKRWSEGGFQTLFTKYSPLGKFFNIGLTFSYLPFSLWAPDCLPVLCYSIIPSLYLLKGVPLFPQVSSVWFLPFAYLVVTTLAYSCAEFLYTDGTLLGWWNEQRMWLYKRLSAYLLAFLDITLKLAGCSNSTFVISAKVSDEDVCVRYEQEMMEFGSDSPMFTILSSVAMLNLLCFVGAVKKMVTQRFVFENLGLQIVLCGVLVLINLPIYNGMLLRKDKGRMPSTVTYKAIVVALSACTFFTFL
nr:cellulose synthase-like protein E1 [Ipomoea trifida]